MRLIPSIPLIPKRFTPSDGKKVSTLTLDNGETVRIPVGTFQHFCVNSVHCNPRYWPHAPRSARNPAKTDDLEDFVPERWMLDDNDERTNSSTEQLRKSAQDQQQQHSERSIDALQDHGESDISASSLFAPPRGAFVPFSDGPRGCLGRRFAMVELVGVAARILKDYAVELDVRPFLGPSKMASGSGMSHAAQWEESTIHALSPEEREVVYAKASARAWRILDEELSGLTTLQQKGKEKIGLRFVRRDGGGMVFV
ncbi:MAG: hypothetical protein LQ341_007421 [Variospora aurantia]|nr:MAG: hypothetical protein LQ341_007421 [Variospora aurantia]